MSKDTSAATAAAAAAIEAADLVKHTAATTAEALVQFTAANTKLALNIEYIQRDLAELKQDFKDSKLKYITAEDHKTLCDEIKDHEDRLRFNEKAIWVASGGVIILEILLRFFVK